jgi:TRAP-type C4-dicarboxylate transport system substrate-binding protein
MYLMAEYMERSLPGSFDIEVYPASTLFTQSQQIPAMTRGNLEFGYVNMFDISAQVPEASILTAGYLIRDIDHHCTVLKSDFGQSILAQVEDKMGIKTIGQALIGYRTLVLREKQEVNVPADIADLTMRETGTEAFQFLAEALGAKPTPIAYSELYLALQTGTVDAFAGFATAMENTKFYEVTEQFVLTNHLVGVDLIGVSVKFWDTLSDEEKAVVLEAADVASMSRPTAGCGPRNRRSSDWSSSAWR